MAAAEGAPSKIWRAPENLDLLRTARLFDSSEHKKCGHAVPLDLMVERIHQRSPSCPVCGATVAFVVDGVDGDSSANHVAFKYGKQVYRLTVPPPNLFQRYLPYKILDPPTAQARIAQVLDFDLQNGMKILYQGKVLYPGTAEKLPLSKLLVQISRNKHNMLLVMGTPQPPSKPWSLYTIWARALQWLSSTLAYVGRNSVSLLLLGRASHQE